jgi:hypothetical protein
MTIQSTIRCIPQIASGFYLMAIRGICELGLLELHSAGAQKETMDSGAAMSRL